MLPAIRLLLLLSLLASPEIGQRTNLQPEFNIFTIAQDIELGRKTAAEIEADATIIRISEVTAYLNALGNSLATKAPQNASFRFQWRIINDRKINAFGLPGGIVYVNRGTFEAAENEAQFANVLAHEIAHVVLRHGSHQLSTAYSLQSPVSSLGAIGRVSVLDALNKISGSFAASSIVLKSPLEVEEQADVLGVQITYDAGYDPQAATSFLEIAEARTASARRPINHPETVDRIISIGREIKRLGPARQDVIIDSPAFQNAKSILQQLP